MNANVNTPIPRQLVGYQPPAFLRFDRFIDSCAFYKWVVLVCKHRGDAGHQACQQSRYVMY